MSISISDYLNGNIQNTWTTSAEKQRQKDGTTEVGKTQQSAVSASLDEVNMGEDGVAISQVSRLQGTEQSVTQKQSAAPRVDTVEISEEGKAASAKLQGKQTEATSAEGYEAETDDLSEYTDSELKQMYYKGEITRQEYENRTGETLE